MRDLRLALRFLLKKPGWVAAAVLTVAIGIAGSTLAFSLVDRALWRPLGFADGGELITLYARSGVEYSTIAWPDYVAFRDVLHDDGEGPADLAAFVRTFSTVGGGEFPELHEGELVSGNFFSVLRVQPFLGRIIAPSDNVAPGAHSVIVLSHMLWRTQFASDPDVVGRDLLLDGRRFEVIGVAPPGFRGPVWPSFESAFWIPALMAAEEFGVDDSRVFGSAALPVFQTVGRVRGGQRIEALQARIDPLDAVLSRDRVDNPSFPDMGQPWRVAVLPGNYLRLWPEYREPVGRVLLMLGLMAMAGLLVGCANLATLLIARGLERRRELAVRRALGAGALDLARRVGAEVVLLVAAGGTLAAGLVYTLSPLTPLLPLGVPYELDLGPDRRVLAIGVAVAALAALLFAALPLAQVLRDGTSLAERQRMGTTGSRGVRAMNGLVVVQVALSLVLLVSCGLLVRSAFRTAEVDLGFHAGRGLTARVTVPGLTAEERAVLFGALVDRLRDEPFVEAASASGGGAVVSFLPAREVYVHDSPVAGPASAVTARYRPVSRDYFETLGIPLLAGRDFEAAEESGAAVAVVNRTLAELYWPGTNPIGHSLQWAVEDQARRIVGVVGDAARRDVRSPAYAMVYVPLAQDPPGWTWVNLRTRADPRGALPALREHLRALEAGGAVSAPRTFAELRFDATRDARLQAGLASALAAVAATLALVGLYGLMGYVVGRRQREIGVRAALGATPASIVRLMLRRAERLTGIGLLLGLGASVLATGGLASLLYEIDPRDPPTLAGAAVILGMASMLAAFAPARSAARVDPAIVLRGE
ncbi:MAG: FtsX-like permease family protein [Acidobacteria bacterium]|nr:FtsX-like permease family protein [Acidobacteriota bacterium]